MRSEFPLNSNPAIINQSVHHNRITYTFYLLTFPGFPLRKKEHKSYFGKNRTHDFHPSRCAGYLLDYSDVNYYNDSIDLHRNTHAY